MTTLLIKSKSANKALQLTWQYAAPLRYALYCQSAEFNRWKTSEDYGEIAISSSAVL
jgi:hypothetical protein